MSKCNVCGFENVNDASFCVSCGSAMPQENPVTNQTPTVEQPDQAQAGQSYQAPTGEQPYQAPTGAQPYQAPTGAQPYQAPVGEQSYQAPTGEQPNQAPAGAQPYQAPAGAQPYQAPAGAQLNQAPTGAQSYQAPTGTQSYQAQVDAQPAQESVIPQSPFQQNDTVSSQSTFSGSYSGMSSQDNQFGTNANQGTQSFGGYGQTQAYQNTAQPIYGQSQAFGNPAQPINDPNFMGQPPKKKHTGLIVGLIIGAVAIIAAIVVVCFIFFGKGSSGSYEEVVENFEDAMNEKDIDKLFDLFPIPEKASSLIDMYLTDDVKEELMDEMESSFGGGEIEIEIVDATQLDQDELDDIAENGRFSYFSVLADEEFELTDGYEVECDVSLDGVSGSGGTITVCEWNGEWYIFDIGD